MNNKLLIAVFAAQLGSTSIHAAGKILAASIRSNSVEEFNTSGTWLKTFATTGPYSPVALAESTSTISISPPTFSTPDPVYQISTAGAATKFIFGTAAPVLGSDHIWCAAWMIFH